METKTAKKLASRLLLAFVLASIGCAVVKETALRRGPDASPADSGDGVVVYYLHGTIRCVTCNKIERMAHETVQQRFAPELAAGRVRWEVVNFEKDTERAGRYNITSSVVVVSCVRDGQDTAFRRLDDVWTLHGKPDEFAAYVERAVRAYLDGEPPQ